ncbi:MAG: DUF4252 domain-containing protein [Prevotella sp.]|jgi:hypothetical protein|nr:DUF4252 domain-containing protein [Prevotella sp.]
MKRILLLLVCVCMTGMVLAQDALFKKYGNTRGVETVFISKSMLSMMPTVEVNDKRISSKKIDRIQMLSCERPSMVRTIKTEAVASFERGHYEEMMRMHDGDEQTIIYCRSLGRGINEFVLMETERDEINIINIQGRITLSDIKHLAE